MMGNRNKYFVIATIILALVIVAGAFLIRSIKPSLKPSPTPTPPPVSQTTPELKPKWPPDATAGCQFRTILSLEQLTDQAETIVRGQVEKIIASKEQDGFIYTRITIKPTESFKQQIADSLDIKVMGGEVGGITLAAGCQARFNQDEEVMVFLKKDVQSGQFKVVGALQGKFTIFDSQVSRGIPQEAIWHLEEFLKKIKTLSQGQSFKPPQNIKWVLETTLRKISRLIMPKALAFTLDGPPPHRWFSANIPVTFKMHDQPYPPLGASTYNLVREAFSWWNGAGANVSIADGGLYSDPGAGGRYIHNNNVNEIAFIDLAGDLVGLFNATTYYWWDCTTTETVNGTSFCRTTETDILVNDKALITAQYFRGLIAHEFGHVLGLGHVSTNALMVAIQPFELLSGLLSDDINGIKFIYPLSGVLAQLEECNASGTAWVNIGTQCTNLCPLPPPPTPAPGTSTITANVYIDSNDNGAKDTGEPLYTATAVSLFISAPGSPSSVDTDSTGQYIWNVLAGTYVVNMGPAPAGYSITPTIAPINSRTVTVPPNGFANFGIKPTVAPLCYDPCGLDTITCSGGCILTSCQGNCGFWSIGSSCSSISPGCTGTVTNCTSIPACSPPPPPTYPTTATVYIDSNGNGFQDGGEGGYSGASLFISPGSPSSGTTNTSGQFIWNVLSGGYTVSLSVPSGYIATTATSLFNSVPPNWSPNFGIRQVYTISGKVTLDNNSDGCSSSTQGVSNTSLTAVNLSTFVSTPGSSDGFGNYLINNLISGNYSLSVSNPPGRVVARRIDGGLWTLSLSPLVSLILPPDHTVEYCINTSTSWIQTTEGDVHSNTKINTPGGP